MIKKAVLIIFTTLLLITLSTAQPTPIAHWEFEQTGNTLHDSSSNQNDGICHGSNCPTFEANSGPQGSNSRLFDGTNDYYIVQDDPSLTLNDDFTITYWEKPESINAGDQNQIITQYYPFNQRRFTFGHQPNGNFQFNLGGASCTTNNPSNTDMGVSSPLNTWVHVAWVVKTSQGVTELYLDGDNVASATYTPNNFCNNPTSNIQIGRRGDNKEYFNGNVDDVRIYNQVLSEADIQSIANITPDTTPPTVELLQPNNGSEVNETILIIVNATDNEEVQTVSIYLNQTLLTTLTAEPYTFSWDTTSNSNGDYTLHAEATDASGNSATTPSTYVTINNPPDTTPPVISSITVTPDAYTATIGWDTNESATSRVDYGPTAALGSFIQDTGLTTTHSLELTSLALNTTYYYVITSTDAAGNNATTATSTFSTLEVEPCQGPTTFSGCSSFSVPMRDGVNLTTQVCLPSGPGPHSTVLLRGYSSNPNGYVQWNSEGYALASQRTRDNAGNQGYRFFPDKDDGYDTIEWVSNQCWNDGNVAMYGKSYGAATQWRASLSHHPNLKAIIPQNMNPSFWSGVYWYQGALSLAMTATGRAGTPSTYEDLMFLPLIDMDNEFLGYDHPLWTEYITNTVFEGYWKNISIRQGEFHNVPHMPIHIQSGWDDYYARQSLATFSELQSLNTGQDIRVHIGNWNHLGDPGISTVANWLDYVLKGINNSYATEPPVKLWVRGADEYRYENEWPLARTLFTKYYLSSPNGSRIGTLTTTPPGTETPTEYVYDPADPAPTISGSHSFLTSIPGLIEAGQRDHRPNEVRDDILVFSTPPLTEDMDLIGPVTMKLYATTTALDTDWVVKLIDVQPDGTALNLGEGIIRARYRGDIHQTPTLLTPNQLYEYDIQLSPVSNEFKAGHQIRIHLTSSSFPQWDRNPNTGNTFGMDAHLTIANQTIHHDSIYPSHIVLPIVPNVSLGTLEGYVTHLATTTPLSGVTVTTNPALAPVVTDSSGYYNITLPEGTYEVTYTAPGYNQAITPNVTITVHQTTSANASLSEIQPPSQPTNFTATALNALEVHLTWTDTSTTETAFIVERSTHPTENFTLHATLPANTQSYVDSPVESATPYYYRLHASNQGLASSTIQTSLTLPQCAPPQGYQCTAQELCSGIQNAGLCCTTTCQQPPQITSVGNWTFNEGSGSTAFDTSGNDHHGTLTNGAGWATSTNCQDGTCITLDGSNDYVNLGTLDIGDGTAQALTIAAWINADDFGYKDGRIISKATSTSRQDHYWMLSTVRSGGASKLRVRLKTNGFVTELIPSSTSLQTGTWTHVAVTYDGTTLTIYQDGINIATTPLTGTIDVNPTVEAHVGDNPNQAAGYNPRFDGKIDSLLILDTALTEQEVQALL